MQKASKLVGGLTLASSMLWMSLLPTAAAYASSGPSVQSVTLSSSASNGKANPGDTVTFTATAVDPNGTPEYQFWYEDPSGVWHGQNWSTNNTFQLNNVQAGSYEVVVYAIDQSQAQKGQWSAEVNSEQTNSNQFVNVQSSVSLTASATSVAPLTQVTLRASYSNLTNPVFQFWVYNPNTQTWTSSGPYSTTNTYSFTPPNAGTYQVVVYAKDLDAPQNASFAVWDSKNIAVYGQAAAVKLSAASSSLVADGTATDTITATVVDASGNTVANYNGTETLAFTTSPQVLTPVIAGTPTGIKITPVTSSFTSKAPIANGAEFTIQEVDANGNPVAPTSVLGGRQRAPVVRRFASSGMAGFHDSSRRHLAGLRPVSLLPTRAAASEECRQLVEGHSGLAQEGSERARRQLAMERHEHHAAVGMTQLDGAAALAGPIKTRALQALRDGAPAERGSSWHQEWAMATSMEAMMGGGGNSTGGLSSKESPEASRTLANAVSRVSPWLVTSTSRQCATYHDPWRVFAASISRDPGRGDRPAAAAPRAVWNKLPEPVRAQIERLIDEANTD